MKHLIATILLVAISINYASAQDPARQDLGLSGCPVAENGLAISSDGGFLVAGCDAPRGLYYSFDSGANWTFASGGEYTGGSNRGVFIVGDAVFARAGNANALLRSAGPTGSSWTPNWVNLSTTSNVNIQAITAHANFVLVGDAQGTVHVYNSAGTEVATSILQNVVALSVGTSFIYALATDNTLPTNANRRLYRNTFNATSGAIGTTWTDISDATGIPDDTYFWNVLTAPDDSAVYLGCRSLVNGSFSDKLYRSTDNGANFSFTNQTFVPNSACFNGTTHLVSTSVSKDSGGTFTALQLPTLGTTTNRIEDKTCAIDPTNSSKVFIATNQGFAVSENVTGSGSPSFTNAVNGFQSVLVKALHAAKDNPDRVMLGTSSGVAFTDNYTATTPSWLYPICPGNDCVGGQTVLVDPSNSNLLYYGSGNIRKGTVTGSGSNATVDWTNYADKPADTFSITSFTVYDFAPRTLYVSYSRTEGSEDGGVYTYDLNSNNPSGVSLAGIQGKPVAAFFAVSAELLFASVQGQNAPGVYRSTDSGVTFTLMNDADLPAGIAFNKFAYDEQNDILYAAGQNNGNIEPTVYVLKNADTASNWTTAADGLPLPENTPPSPAGVSAITIDADSSAVFAASGAYIWVSTDSGDTWVLFYTDLEGTSTNVLQAPEDSTAAAAVRINTTARQLVQGGNTGFAALGGVTLASCELTVPKKKKPSKSSSSSKKSVVINTGFIDVFSGDGLGQLTVDIQQKKGRTFKKIKRIKTGANGTKKVTIKTTQKSLTLRAVSNDPTCTTKQVKAKTK